MGFSKRFYSSSHDPQFIIGEGIKIYVQDTQPVLDENKTIAVWENTINDKCYLIYKNRHGVEKLVELS
jgi:hypothetical protein